MPLAVIATVISLAIIHVLACLALVGMQPFEEAIVHDQNRTSAFGYAFRYNGVEWAYQIVSIGELVTLPLAVLLALLCQTRVQFAMGKDGLLPPIFSEINASGNLFKVGST